MGTVLERFNARQDKGDPVMFTQIIDANSRCVKQKSIDRILRQ
jgi:hypothetical protein